MGSARRSGARPPRDPIRGAPALALRDQEDVSTSRQSVTYRRRVSRGKMGSPHREGAETPHEVRADSARSQRGSHSDEVGGVVPGRGAERFVNWSAPSEWLGANVTGKRRASAMPIESEPPVCATQLATGRSPADVAVPRCRRASPRFHADVGRRHCSMNTQLFINSSGKRCPTTR